MGNLLFGRDSKRTALTPGAAMAVPALHNAVLNGVFYGLGFGLKQDCIVWLTENRANSGKTNKFSFESIDWEVVPGFG